MLTRVEPPLTRLHGLFGVFYGNAKGIHCNALHYLTSSPRVSSAKRDRGTRPAAPHAREMETSPRAKTRDMINESTLLALRMKSNPQKLAAHTHKNPSHDNTIKVAIRVRHAARSANRVTMPRSTPQIACNRSGQGEWCPAQAAALRSAVPSPTARGCATSVGMTVHRLTTIPSANCTHSKIQMAASQRRMANTDKSPDRCTEFASFCAKSNDSIVTDLRKIDSMQSLLV